VWDDLQLICFPPDDASFAERVQTLLDEFRGSRPTEADLLAAVLDGLRRDYPKVRIRSRDPIAEFELDGATWYVYRDGRPAGDEPPSGRGRRSTGT
jgi:hypothetical protein